MFIWETERSIHREKKDIRVGWKKRSWQKFGSNLDRIVLSWQPFNGLQMKPVAIVITRDLHFLSFRLLDAYNQNALDSDDEYWFSFIFLSFGSFFLGNWSVACVCLWGHFPGTVRRWFLFIHVSSSSATVSRHSQATLQDVWSPWKRSKSQRCVIMIFNVIT